MSDSVNNAAAAIPLLVPDLALPPGVHICTTMRAGGVSKQPYDSLNLGLHVGDEVEAVKRNRAVLESTLQLPLSPIWLNQTHGTQVCTTATPSAEDSFDASWTDCRGRVLAVLTADCLPVAIVDKSGSQLAVAHAGWRGLAAGVLQNTVEQFSVPANQLVAWLGPAIGPLHFEVGAEVFDCFRSKLQDRGAVESAFKAGKVSEDGNQKYYADLYRLATTVLYEVGLESVYGGEHCTYSNARDFYSYRRDGSRSGRMATLVWRD